ncbi:hypothetical protein Cs7R123_50660 [Catellatospora sp. TT07R-123]|uniref:2-hydroxy-acid oxidase n=1 Tax=Catellatospora sp. TT07R-123 TaxID=2733863 RepID=UPI001B00CCEE|nr:2-hydroxy-acid oxidase [Catellatospora sp. TT07R-123]GHJ47724.1 hypothetical protein Cs7R123_50660 [Catellatospora sp. TT07R-123]
MFTAGTPSPSGGGLALSRVRRQAFGAAPPLPPEHLAALAVFTADLVAPYGLAATDAGPGHTYGEMAAELIAAAVGGHEPVNLLVLAFAVPDLRPGRATATYLSHVCPGGPLAFAVCDQGTAAAFTGLRLARDYLGGGGCDRALVLVVEQAAVPYPVGPSAAVPDGPAAVALLCERTGPTRLRSLAQHPDVGPGQAAELLAEQVAAAGDGVRVVLGAGLAAAAGGLTPLPVRAAGPGRPHTGAWWELAAEPDAGQVLVADYDPLLRYLSVAAFTGWSADVAGVQARREDHRQHRED